MSFLRLQCTNIDFFWSFAPQKRSPDALAHLLTGQFTDKPTFGHSNRGLDNSRTGELADSEFENITFKAIIFFLQIFVKHSSR